MPPVAPSKTPQQDGTAETSSPFRDNLHKSYYDNTLEWRYCFPPSDPCSNAPGAPLLPRRTRETISEVASKHWRCLRFHCPSRLKSVLVGTVLFWVFKRAVIKASSDFFRSGERVGEREVAPRAADPVGTRDEGDAASPWRRAACCRCSHWYVDLYGWVSGLHQQPRYCGVNVAENVLLFFLILIFSPYHFRLSSFQVTKPLPYVPTLWNSYEQHILTRGHNLKQVLFPASTAGRCLPNRERGWFRAGVPTN